jgi:integrase
MKYELMELVDEMQAGISRSDVLFEDYAVNQWLKIYCAALSPTTLNEYERKLNTDILPVLGKKKLKDITFSDIQQLMNKYSESHASKTSRDLLGVMSAIFNHAIIYDKIRKDNPCTGIKIKRTPKKEPYVYTLDEMLEYLAVVLKSVYAIPILLASVCGLRLSEVCGLRWEDVDFEKNRISIKRAAVVVKSQVIVKVTKTESSYRTIIMPSLVSQVLKKQRGMPSAYVYPNPDGTPTNGNLLSKRIARFRKKHGFADTRYHDLRHFSATMLFEQGIPDKQIAKVLGHSDTNMTKKYQHILRSIEERPVNAMNKILEPLQNNDNSQVSNPVSNEEY